MRRTERRVRPGVHGDMVPGHVFGLEVLGAIHGLVREQSSVLAIEASVANDSLTLEPTTKNVALVLMSSR